MQLLNVDLNEIASKEIQGKIESLESEINRLESVNLNQSERISSLQKQVKDEISINSFMSIMRTRFHSMQNSEPDSGG